MAATGYSITDLTDIPATGTVDNTIKDKTGQKLSAASRLQFFLSAEGPGDVQAQITVGGTQVLNQGPVALQPAVGTLPSTQDDMLLECFGQAGDEILIFANNSNVASREIATLVRVMPLDDAVIGSALKIRGRQT